jgi:two-component system, sensor histidine kinase and response regulator
MSRRPIPLLLVEDNPGDARLLREALRDLGEASYALEVVETLDGGLSRLGNGRFEAVLLDLSLPDSHGLDTLLAVRRHAPSIPVVVLTGLEDESVALDTLKAGAQDYLVKGRFDSPLLDRSLRYAIERQRADESVKRSVSLLQATLDATVDGILVADLERRVVSSNRRFVEMWGIPDTILADGDDRRLVDYISGQLRDPQRFVEKIEEIYGQSGDETYDLLEFVDGRVYERYSTPQILEGRSIGRVWSFHDVTERKRAVDELREATRSAEAANRAKSDFLASLSHEVRTPLNTILGMADLLSETTLADDQREYLNILRRSADLMLGLVNDVLDLSKIEAGRLELERVEFSFRELVDGALSLLSRAAREKHLELRAEVASALADRVVGDPVRVRQILVNLVANALKFTETGGVFLRAEPDRDGATNPRFERLLVTVQDTGVGIPSDRLESIFEQFIQVDSSVSRQYGGTGLGLAICRRLVRRMGGTIWAESEPGRGSTFRFTIELERAGAGDAPRPSSPLSGSRVLVVSASEADRLLARRGLERAGAVVDEAENGDRAAELVESAPSPASFSALVVDARLPPRGGFEVLEELRPHFPSLDRVLLLLPEQHRKDDVARLAALGVGRYLVRPFDADRLVAAIEGLLARPAAAPPDHGNHPIRVLVAEDSEDNRRLIRFFLQKSPYDVAYAENGEAAVGLYMENPFDVVLMDLQMPVLDGLSATQAIRRWEESHGRKPAAILAVSAHALPEDVRRSIAAGCTAHLTKPIKRDRLLTAIQEHAKA